VEAWNLQLVESVREGKLSKVTELLDPEAPGLLCRIEPLPQMTLLMLAASKGHIDIARLLVWSGAKVDQRNPKGRTALMHACIAGHDECSSLFKVKAIPNLGREPLRETIRTVPTKS
jgi:hypothetical protein